MREFDIIVAYDDPLKRLGIKAMLEAPKELKFKLHDNISDLNKLKQTIIDLQPDFIVIDATLNSNNSGIELAIFTKTHAKNTKIVMMTFDLDNHLKRILKKLEIKWVMYKADTVESMKKSAWRAIHNKPYISKKFREKWYENDIDVDSIKKYNPLEKLSKTEITILQQVAKGKTNKEIALEFYKSIKTIKNHRQNICSKLGLHGSNALLKYAIELKNEILSPRIPMF
ncbi:response regulator transcription factor [Aquimarina celericrescens]|uniref:DNA-binding response regulator n=1 Tax=Aquimarina celericrescens TaxID=1964542 RepID=A0ABW5B2T4_9FLAO|nr:response regulator transcription factor [Aquimarina celericrescens]